MSDNSDETYPVENVNDKSYALARGLISSVPILSGIATELFGLAIAAPVEKRREAWFADLLARFQQLEREHANFSYAKAFEDEVFVTTFLLASRHAQTNHNRENIKALRNAVLNSALPKAPDEISQKLFVMWAGELTAWHLQILTVFERDGHLIPTLDLSDEIFRRGGIYADRLSDLLETRYPEMKGRTGYHLQLQIIGELYTLGLISNRSPSKGMMTEKHDIPVLTNVAKDFLKFITSPLADDSAP